MASLFRLLALLLCFFGCPREGGKSGGVEPDPQGPHMVKASFVSPDGRISHFILEVAATPEQRARGLMFRKTLAPDRGMVFVFPFEEIQTFYMKNTYIPLDMIFIDATYTVVGVIENAEPLSTKLLSVEKPSKFVVELNATTAAKHGIVIGSRVSFEPPLRPALR